MSLIGIEAVRKYLREGGSVVSLEFEFREMWIQILVLIVIIDACPFCSCFFTDERV